MPLTGYAGDHQCAQNVGVGTGDHPVNSLDWNLSLPGRLPGRCGGVFGCWNRRWIICRCTFFFIRHCSIILGACVGAPSVIVQIIVYMKAYVTMETIKSAAHRIACSTSTPGRVGLLFIEIKHVIFVYKIFLWHQILYMVPW